LGGDVFDGAEGCGFGFGERPEKEDGELFPAEAAHGPG
jgi:hypothetical protein